MSTTRGSAGTGSHLAGSPAGTIAAERRRGAARPTCSGVAARRRRSGSGGEVVSTRLHRAGSTGSWLTSSSRVRRGRDSASSGAGGDPWDRPGADRTSHAGRLRRRSRDLRRVGGRPERALTRRGPSFPTDAGFHRAFTGVTLAVDDADEVSASPAGARTWLGRVVDASRSRDLLALATRTARCGVFCDPRQLRPVRVCRRRRAAGVAPRALERGSGGRRTGGCATSSGRIRGPAAGGRRGSFTVVAHVGPHPGRHRPSSRGRRRARRRDRRSDRRPRPVRPRRRSGSQTCANLRGRALGERSRGDRRRTRPAVLSGAPIHIRDYGEASLPEASAPGSPRPRRCPFGLQHDRLQPGRATVAVGDQRDRRLAARLAADRDGVRRAAGGAVGEACSRSAPSSPSTRVGPTSTWR